MTDSSPPARQFRVIGFGRAGGAMQYALEEMGWVAHPPRGRGDDLSDAGHDEQGRSIDVVIVAVPDDAIASVATQITPTGAAIVHLAGSRPVTDLAGHDRVGSVHPLASLPDPVLGAQRLLDSTTFAVAGDVMAREIVDALGGTAIDVADADRALYHATAAIAANHLVALCAQVERLAHRLGIPPSAYWRLAGAAFANVQRNGATASLTGPAARGDWATIASHLEALPPDEHGLYLPLSRAAAELAGLTWPSDLPIMSPLSSSDAHNQREPSLPSSPTVLHTIDDLRATLDRQRAQGATIGFVPTMGYLHAGHRSLMEQARAQCDVVVVSIFVNPLQFAANEDLSQYPRDLERDIALCQDAGVDCIFIPSVDEMYPHGAVLTTVTVADLSARWEGATRPTHFAGVATVVAKLFAIVGACRAYFGEKDFQQLSIIRRMALDLSLPVEVIGCPIVREDDGLALSSRNVYLGPEDRLAARVLSQALQAAIDAAHAGERDGGTLAAIMTGVVTAEPRAELDYAAVVDADTLDEVAEINERSRFIIAAKIGHPRLLDNSAVFATEPLTSSSGPSVDASDSPSSAPTTNPRVPQS